MKQIEINCDESILQQADEVLENTGIDLIIAVEIMVRRIVKEKSASFLLKTNQNQVTQIAKDSTYFEHKMSKSRSISLFKQKGHHFVGNVTYASKNRSADNYWANPPFEYLDKEWNLILNDWINRQLYLFVIPAESIGFDKLIARSDMLNIIDLQIMYNDNTFTDNRSKFSFCRFLKDTIQY